MKRKISLLLLATGLMLTNNSFAGSPRGVAFAPSQEWENLGSRIVNMAADHDEIIVTLTDGFYTKLKLKIMKAPIHLLNINIIFGNGDNKNVVFDKLFPAGSETALIDLPGNRRIIKKVNLNYKSVPSQKGRAVITLWGKH
jgi:hypothetical protein